MNGEQLDRWAIVLKGVEHITHDRCKEPVAEISPALDRLLTVLLEIVYDRNTTEQTCRRLEEVIRLTYGMGRSNEHLYNHIIRRG